jgi:hypothetical protein
VCFDECSVFVTHALLTPTALGNADRTRTAWTLANKDVILMAAKRRPWRSSRNFSRNLGHSQQKNEEEEEKIRRSQRSSERYYIHYGEERWQIFR